MSLAALLPRLRTVIVKTTVCPGASVAVGALPLTSTSLPAAVRVPPQPATASANAMPTHPSQARTFPQPTPIRMTANFVTTAASYLIGRIVGGRAQDCTKTLASTRANPHVRGCAGPSGAGGEV